MQLGDNRIAPTTLRQTRCANRVAPTALRINAANKQAVSRMTGIILKMTMVMSLGLGNERNLNPLSPRFDHGQFGINR